MEMVAKHAHTPNCKWVVKRNGKRYCQTNRNERDRFQRQAGLRDYRNQKTQRPVDGWEDEYGPCPYPVPVDRWVDEVAVLRAVAGQPVGRALGMAEGIAVQRRIAEMSRDE